MRCWTSYYWILTVHCYELIYSGSGRVEDTTSQWLGVSVKSHKPGGQILVRVHFSRFRQRHHC